MYAFYTFQWHSHVIQLDSSPARRADNSRDALLYLIYLCTPSGRLLVRFKKKKPTNNIGDNGNANNVRKNAAVTALGRRRTRQNIHIIYKQYGPTFIRTIIYHFRMMCTCEMEFENILNIPSRQIKKTRARIIINNNCQCRSVCFFKSVGREQFCPNQHIFG